MKPVPAKRLFVTFGLAAVLIAACVSPGPGGGELHRWWSGLSPVLPHGTFPGDCKLCHVGQKWNTLVDNFSFDHEAKTGHKLNGAHTQAQCLRCHNDRGPVQTFQTKGCVGCHEDRHSGRLGNDCSKCHTERTWQAFGQLALHNRTRFPLVGVHASVSCHRCHPGGFVGNFTPSDSDCETCHQDELAATQNPPHIPLGWVNSCERCHAPTRWNQAIQR